MSSVENIDSLTRHTERLICVVTGEDDPGGEDDVADTLESFKTVSSSMTASDLNVVLLTIKSIIYKCVSSVRGGYCLDGVRLRVLVALLLLNLDLDPDSGLTAEVMVNLVRCDLPSATWLQLMTSLGDEIFLRHTDLVSTHHHVASVQAGLMSEDNLVRKRAMYLMKRTVDTLNSDIFNLEDKSQLIIGACQSKSDILIHFETYSLIMETLEEKQVHLVRQIIPKINVLLTLSVKSEQSFHFSWILVLFFRLFKHPNIEMVRWGVHTFLTTTFQANILSDENFLSFVCNPFLDVLNETKLYNQNTEETYNRGTSKHITDFLLSLDELTPTSRELILRSLVMAICSKTWAPIPLTWISFSFKDFIRKRRNEENFLTKNELPIVKTFLERGMQYQEPLLRAASQTNFGLFVIQSIEIELCSYNDIIDFLYILHINKVLLCQQESTLWKMSSMKISEYFKTDFDLVLTRFVSENLKSKGNINSEHIEKAITKNCLGVILFLSSQDFDYSLVERFFQEVRFKQSSNRAYEGERYQQNNEEWSRCKLFTLHCIYRIFKKPDPRRGKNFLSYHNQFNKKEIEIFENYGNLSDFEYILNQIIENVIILSKRTEEEFEAIGRVKVYLELLSIKMEKMPNLNQYFVSRLEEIFQMIHSGFSSELKVQKFVAMQTLHTLATTQLCAPALLLREMSKINFEKIFLLSDYQRENDIQNRDEQRIWGKLSGEYLGMKISLTRFKIRHEEISKNEYIINFLNETLETGGRECLLPCLELACDLEVVSGQFLVLAKKIVFEFRKNEVFWPSLTLLVRLSMKNIQKKPDCVAGIFLELINESDTVAGIFPLLMTEMTQQFKMHPSSKVLASLTHIIAMALTYGPVFRKDQKYVTDTNEMIFSLGPKFEANNCEGSDHLMAASVRVNALTMILYGLPSDGAEASMLLVKLFADLQKVSAKTTGVRQRHFENSIIHKVRHRLYQVYVMFCPLLTGEDAAQVLEELGQVLLDHGEQTSVRQSLEWAVTVILGRHPRLLARVWAWLAESGQRRAGVAASLLIIITGHLVTHGKELERGLREVAPWAMAQNFYTRIVAQVCFRKLWAKLEEEGGELMTRFQPLYDCILKSVNTKNSDKITEDFYLTVFDPFICFNIEDLFHNFPKVCDISDGEIIPKELLAGLPACHIPLKNVSSQLDSGVKQSNLKDTIPDVSESQNIQKKATPWTNMMTDLMFQDRKSVTRTQAHAGLMVVASLIDKAPNLGGLCRTSEILGVGALVVGSKNVVRDKEFSAVSVTAEQWLPLLECAPHRLPPFLQERRAEGYKIVAVEQTAESVSLDTFTFPQQCVLLLGKEKEGVPVELLDLVDVCVEIPQHGLIRSLNVHVTGALVIWEYVKQHNLK